MNEYKLSGKKKLVVEENWAAIKIGNKIYTKHIFSEKEIKIEEINIINSVTAIMFVPGDIIRLTIFGTAITAY
jgi:hypothetical protein